MMDTQLADQILDLGSGPGSLSSAAKKRWPNAKITSVDIETKNHRTDLRQITANVFEHNLPEIINLPEGSIDVAVSNPPYIKIKWQESLKSIIESSGLPSSTIPRKAYSAELIFIAQILRMLKPGGEAAVILPDGILTAEKFSEFRKALIENHSVKRVIELPARSFKRTEAKTHIVIFSKAGHQNKSNYIELRTLESNEQISRPIHINHAHGSQRLDYSFYKQKSDLKAVKDSITLSSIATVMRGKQSSSDIKRIELSTVHTTDIFSPTCKLKLKGNDHLISLEKQGYLIARPGDILLARVGRNLNQKIALVTSGYAIVSDCLFIIRSQVQKQQSIFEYLASESGQSSIERLTYGVAARQISKKQLCNLQLEI